MQKIKNNTILLIIAWLHLPLICSGLQLYLYYLFNSTPLFIHIINQHTADSVIAYIYLQTKCLIKCLTTIIHSSKLSILPSLRMRGWEVSWHEQISTADSPDVLESKGQKQWMRQL